MRFEPNRMVKHSAVTARRTLRKETADTRPITTTS
jgi:hypothetical protein